MYESCSDSCVETYTVLDGECRRLGSYTSKPGQVVEQGRSMTWEVGELSCMPRILLYGLLPQIPGWAPQGPLLTVQK